MNDEFFKFSTINTSMKPIILQYSGQAACDRMGTSGSVPVLPDGFGLIVDHQMLALSHVCRQGIWIFQFLEVSIKSVFCPKFIFDVNFSTNFIISRIVFFPESSPTSTTKQHVHRNAARIRENRHDGGGRRALSGTF